MSALARLASRLEEPRLRLRDNPILIAQARRRLRRKQALPTLLVVGLLGLCGLLLGWVTGGKDWRSWDHVGAGLLTLIGAVLYLGGSTQVATTISEDRRSGLLDFHRATPTSAWTDALGYALGSASREYACAGVLLPFAVLATLPGSAGLVDLLLGLLVMLSSTWLYHALALHFGLSPGRRRIPQSVGVLVLMLCFVGAPLSGTVLSPVAHLTPLPALVELGLVPGLEPARRLELFGLPLGSALYSFLIQGYLAAFLFRSAVRKLHRDGAHAFSRRGALGFFAVSALVWLGPVWSMSEEVRSTAVTAAGYLVAGGLLAVALGTSLVPSHLEHVRTVRRARREGVAPAWSEDGTTAWPLVPAFGALLAVGLLAIGACAPAPAAPPPWAVLSLDTLLALVAVAATLALAVGVVESTKLQLGVAARSGTFLIGFLTLVLPWILGLVVSLSALEDATAYVQALSPAYAAGAAILRLGLRWAGDEPGPALAPVVFSTLVTAALAAWFLARAARARAEVLSGRPPASRRAPSR